MKDEEEEGEEEEAYVVAETRFRSTKIVFQSQKINLRKKNKSLFFEQQKVIQTCPSRWTTTIHVCEEKR